MKVADRPRPVGAGLEDVFYVLQGKWRGIAGRGTLRALQGSEQISIRVPKTRNPADRLDHVWTDLYCGLMLAARTALVHVRRLRGAVERGWRANTYPPIRNLVEIEALRSRKSVARA